MRPGAARLVSLSDGALARWEPDEHFSVTVGELRDLVYELRYAESKVKGLELALQECREGLDMHGNPVGRVDGEMRDGKVVLTVEQAINDAIREGVTERERDAYRAGYQTALARSRPATDPAGLDALEDDFIRRLTGPGGPMRTPMRGKPNVTTADAIRVFRETLDADV